jgi:hypothetical protein
MPPLPPPRSFLPYVGSDPLVAALIRRAEEVQGVAIEWQSRAAAYHEQIQALQPLVEMQARRIAELEAANQRLSRALQGPQLLPLRLFLVPLAPLQPPPPPAARRGD